MGGWIGFGLAHHASQRLRGLVLGGQHAYGRAPPRDVPDGHDPELFFRSFFTRIGLEFDEQPAEVCKGLLASDTKALAAAMQDRPSLEAALPAMAMPSVLYAGMKDGVFAQAEKSAKAMPNCTFVALPGLDHSDAFYKATEMLVPKVLGFLRTS